MNNKTGINHTLGECIEVFLECGHDEQGKREFLEYFSEEQYQWVLRKIDDYMRGTYEGRKLMGFQ